MSKWVFSLQRLSDVTGPLGEGLCKSPHPRVALPLHLEAASRAQGQEGEVPLHVRRGKYLSPKCLSRFPLPSHWPELHHVAIHTNRGGWEICFFLTISRMG